jgi:3-phosphoglycerate kinase
MGKYEDPGAVAGTKAILEAIANNEKAYKVAGGGDIETAISTYGLTEKFDWISVGGGAMLEFLATGTLVGIEAVRQ